MYLEDENGRVVDTEMQNNYQGMIDQEILPSGTDYIFLKETYIIFICTCDPFEIMSCIYDA